MGLVIKHVLVIIVHFLQKIDTPYIFVNVVNNLWDFFDHQNLDFVIILNHRNNKLIRKMKQFQSQLRFRKFLAVENKFKNFSMNIWAVYDVLFGLIGTWPFHRKVDKFITSQILINSRSLQCFHLFKSCYIILIFHELTEVVHGCH